MKAESIRLPRLAAVKFRERSQFPSGPWEENAPVVLIEEIADGFRKVRFAMRPGFRAVKGDFLQVAGVDFIIVKDAGWLGTQVQLVEAVANKVFPLDVAARISLRRALPRCDLFGLAIVEHMEAALWLIDLRAGNHAKRKATLARLNA